MGTKIKKIFPIRITTVGVERSHMMLFYIPAGEKYHYLLTKDFSRLVSSQYNNRNSKQHFWQYCLHGCTNEEVLKKHLEKRKLHRTQRIKLPEAGNKKGRAKINFTKT